MTKTLTLDEFIKNTAPVAPQRTLYNPFYTKVNRLNVENRAGATGASAISPTAPTAPLTKTTVTYPLFDTSREGIRGDRSGSNIKHRFFDCTVPGDLKGTTLEVCWREGQYRKAGYWTPSKSYIEGLTKSKSVV